MPDPICPTGQSALATRPATAVTNQLLRPFYSNTGPAAGWLDPIVWQLEKTPFTERPGPGPPPLRSMTNGPPATAPQGPLVPWDPFEVFFWCVGLRAMQSGDFADVETALAARGRLGLFKTHESGAGLLDPAFAWATLPDRFYVFVRGTDQYAQASNYVLRHAYDETTGIPGWGSVNSAWVDAGLIVADTIGPDWVAAGRPPLGLVGHSYGAPAAAVAMMQLTSPGRNQFDRLVTAGAPLWGTQSLVQRWSMNQHIRLVTADDPVVQLPPPAAIVSVLLAIGVLPAASLGRYFHLAPGLLLTRLSGAVVQPTTDLSAAEWLAAAAMIAIGRAGFEPHYISHYADLASAWIGLAPAPLPIGWDDFPGLVALNAKLAAAGN